MSNPQRFADTPERKPQMFNVGQKVRDSQGQEGRVTDVDVCEGKASYTVRFGKYELVRFTDELEAA